VILLEQIRTIDKRRLREKMGHLDEHLMERVNNAISVSCGLGGERGMPFAEPIAEPSEEEAAAMASARRGGNAVIL